MSEEKEYRDESRLDLPSASGMSIVVDCPGQPNLKRLMPDEAFKPKEKKEEADEWAESGTRIHAAFETGSTLELSEDEERIYKQGAEYQEQIVKKWVSDKAIDEYEEGPREMRVWLHDPLNFPELLGSVQLDRHYIARKRKLVLITDFKSGFNPNLPPSPRSWQLRFGAVALHQEEYDWVEEIRVAHCKAQQKHTVKDFCDYNKQDLEYSWQSIRYHLWLSTQPDAPRHAGPHCNWCPCKAYCIEAGAYSLMPSVIAARAMNMTQFEMQEAVQLMTDADLYRVWDSSTINGKIIKAVKGRLKEFDAERLETLGLELDGGRKNDSVTDVPNAFLELTKSFAEQEVIKMFQFSKEMAVEIVRREKSLGKSDAEKWIDKYLDPYITRKLTEPSLRRMK